MPIPADEAMVDGNLVTAPMARHPSWLAEFLKLLGTRIEHPEMVLTVFVLSNDGDSNLHRKSQS